MIELGKKIKSKALPGNGTGEIIKKYENKKGANGEDLYEIIDENGQIHSMVPSLFDDEEITPKNDSKKEESVNLSLSREIIIEQTEQAIHDIIKELGLEESDDVMIQLKNCCLLQKYIVEHNDFDKSIVDEKESYDTDDLVIRDLYNGVVLHNGVCMTNAIMFKNILQRVGVNVEILGLISNDTNVMHASNIVELDGEYYFFDSTLEKSIYDENSQDGEFYLCAAGLGKNEYCSIYTPEVMLPDDPNGKVLPLPENISDYRIPSDVVNSLIPHDMKNNKKEL